MHTEERGHFSRALATVVAETINIDVERRCGGIHLEANGLPLVDADAGRKALNRIVSGAADVPLGVGRARVQVFTDDRIGPALGPGMLIRTLGNGENQRGRQAKRPGDRPARKQHEMYASRGWMRWWESNGRAMMRA